MRSRLLKTHPMLTLPRFAIVTVPAMDLANALRVTSAELMRLSSTAAVELFTKLLWAEANRIGIGSTLVSVPSAITVSDGGVDAEVGAFASSRPSSLIQPGGTCYQIKTGSFSPAKTSDLNNLICKPHKPGRARVLNDRVKECLDSGGAFVGVIFGWDGPDAEASGALTQLRDRLAGFDPKYKLASVELWRANQVLGFLEPFPSLRLEIKGGSLSPFHMFDAWSRFGDMRVPYVSGNPQEEVLTAIRQTLRDRNDWSLRVIADPGSGKTRTVLEALRAPDLAPLVLFSDRPSDVEGSDVFNRMLVSDSTARAILVVDECNATIKSTLVNKLAAADGRVQLITICSDADRPNAVQGVVSPELLDDDQVRQVIEGYGVPADSARRWVELCSGSPRVANVIGENLATNQEDILKPPDGVSLWDRYIAGSDQIGGPNYQARRTVLMWLSLFKKFGFAEPFDKESSWLFNKIHKEEAMSRGTFLNSIKELRNRHILQGDKTLYISPKALHVFMWREWWNVYGGVGFNLEQFQIDDATLQQPQTLTSEMVDWFFEMFRYAAGSNAAPIVEQLLSPGGPFTIEVLDSSRGSNFFMALAEGDPRSALEFLKRTVGKQPKETLLEFTEGRRGSVVALEMIAVWRDYFHDAARLLKMLALTENESWANNATGVFCGLFSLSYGTMASTEAPPEQRLPLILELLNAPEADERALGIRAVDVALNVGNSFKMVGADWQGLRRLPDLWQPKTWGELFDAYRAVWAAVVGRIPTFDPRDQELASKVILTHTRSLGVAPALGTMVRESLRTLLAASFLDRTQLIEAVEEILHYDGERIEPEAKADWEVLRDQLIGTDFHSRLLRFVALDLLTDKFDENQRPVDKSEEPIRELAREAVGTPALLEPELNWLFTSRAANGFRFGRALCEEDAVFSLLPTLMARTKDATNDQNLIFMCGYVAVIRERNENAWEDLLDDLASSPETASRVLEISWRSGPVTERAALRVLDLVTGEKADFSLLRMFAYGSALSTVSGETVTAFLSYLVNNSSPQAAVIGLDLLSSVAHSKGLEPGINLDIVTKLLLHPAFFDSSPENRQAQMTPYHWVEITRKLIAVRPESLLPIGLKVLDFIGARSSIAGDAFSSVRSILNEATRSHPAEVWEVVAKQLTLPLDSKGFATQVWLSGGHAMFDQAGAGAIVLFPPETLWDWVGADVEKRAWLLGHLVPPDLTEAPGNVSLARELLVRYGDREDVQNELVARFSSGGWTGSTSGHYSAVRTGLEAYLEAETNPLVIQWVKKFMLKLDADVAYWAAHEERGTF